MQDLLSELTWLMWHFSFLIFALGVRKCSRKRLFILFENFRVQWWDNVYKNKPKEQDHFKQSNTIHLITGSCTVKHLRVCVCVWWWWGPCAWTVFWIWIWPQGEIWNIVVVLLADSLSHMINCFLVELVTFSVSVPGLPGSQSPMPHCLRGSPWPTFGIHILFTNLQHAHCLHAGDCFEFNFCLPFTMEHSGCTTDL